MENNSATPPAGANASHSDYLTINGFLEKANMALTNARLPDIAPLLAARDYPAREVARKLEEMNKLRTLNERQKNEYGEQHEATKAYNEARSKVHEDYIDHLELARIAFRKDTGAKTALGLRGDRARSQSGYAGQGLLFYNNALGSADYQAAPGRKGITANDPRDGQAAFKNLQTLTAAQQKETGEAQEATKRRDALYDELSEWMSDFYATAKIVLRKNPQMMEKLGIKEV